MGSLACRGAALLVALLVAAPVAAAVSADKPSSYVTLLAHGEQRHREAHGDAAHGGIGMARAGAQQAPRQQERQPPHDAAQAPLEEESGGDYTHRTHQQRLEVFHLPQMPVRARGVVSGPQGARARTRAATPRPRA